MSASADSRSRSDGTIPLCPHKGCQFTCCGFQQGNYIVLYPGEIDAARDADHSLEHLDVFDKSYHGGARALCKATDTSTCDQGYKPLDCASYPYFPTIGLDDEVEITLKGKKCPLEDADIPYHRAWAERAWQELVQKRPDVHTWLRNVDLVGYKSVFIDRLTNKSNAAARSDSITRPLPYGTDQPRIILDRWKPGCVVEQLLGSWENFVYRVKIDGRPYAMRITSATKRTKELLLGEFDWLSYLKQNGISACQPVRSLSGELVETVSDSDQTFYASIFEWAEGRRIEPEDCHRADRDFFVSWGRLFGRIHALTQNYKPEKNRARPSWVDDVLVRNSDLLLEGAPPRTSQLCREVLKWAGSLPVNSECFGLIHADLHGRNFRVTNDRFMVYDFDDCCYCWFGYDLGCAINWAFPPEHFRRGEALAYLLEGYNQEQVMSQEWRMRIPGMIQLRRVLNLLMIRHEISIRPTFDPKLYHRLALFEKELITTREELC